MSIKERVAAPTPPFYRGPGHKYPSQPGFVPTNLPLANQKESIN